MDFLLFSNIFIASCAVAQAGLTYHLLDAKCDKYVLGILFCSTLSLYNFSMFLAKPKNPEKSPFRRVRWIFANYRFMTTITLIAVISIIPLTFFLSPASQVLLFFLGVIAVAYNLPLFSMNDKKFGLRNIPGLKLFLIALIWSLSCVLLPIIETGMPILASDTIVLIAKRFLFIAAITVPFDIRDLYQDRSHDLKTIPVMLGEKKAYLFCQFLLLIYISLLLLFTRSLDPDFIGISLTILLTGWLIFKSNIRKNEYYYFFFLDGTMILQLASVILSNYIWNLQFG
ncbi:hypothetical protein [Desertivirga brevis]|uniref:hypothetical protein n=1 Tax=Desertivirga brevis TaxID=2810310 RepID=UPI001A979AC5|nr:hypothetical protein [Pedobacter sp. SYSU D00873]